jgi:hypothetical protein
MATSSQDSPPPLAAQLQETAREEAAVVELDAPAFAFGR